VSGKSRYGGGMSNINRYDTAADEARTATAAGTAATDAANQASWAQYVENLVSEQIATLQSGVIAGLGEGINEQLDRLFEETDKFLRRELNANSAKLEAALADIRAAKAEMREEIRAELRVEIRTEIADRVSLIKQPADGVPGPRGEKGEPGSLPMVEPYLPGRIHYRGNVVADETGKPNATPRKCPVPRARTGSAWRDPAQMARMVAHLGLAAPMIRTARTIAGSTWSCSTGPALSLCVTIPVYAPARTGS
jgi:multidrug efflux pump subunit AcrA (membrane-fusion protein)